MSTSSTMITPTVTTQSSRHDAEWYKDAIIYQVHIRSFYDSNQDGIGDLKGLIERLDYIQKLNVSAIWLLPFFPSPLRDGGYDISDYTNVNPAYGTLRDFKQLIQQAHQRGIKIISELVINHTSDQHVWFQRSRRAKPGTKWRNFYVWKENDDAYSDARIIFKDFETSNWSWDPEAKAYYWHRFYHHQPDLNFENPEVRSAIFDLIDFWFDLGVDGLRLDAVPYLFEREGTNCENLPETHAYLKELRQHVDRRHQGKMLLAEANQWPEDAAAYFGDGDECHMNFHFPLMPRLFMALEREENFPIIDILDQTPELPESCQWAIFLRNHDELTLEMVTEEERDYMYRKYASDQRSRVNLGIRRRLAPLLANNRRKIELINALLFSLPGTPIIYYGDEIGMGDNIFLGDRDGVRTPMQWSDGRNADFSRANPQKLFLPVITDPQYHYAKRNVESEQNDPNSLLWWMRRIISLRRQFNAFGHGSLEILSATNGKVLAFVRRFEDEVLLIVANLSRHSQSVELDLSRFDGAEVIELFGHAQFPAIGNRPYVLTLNPHGFYWFGLQVQPADEDDHSLFALPTSQGDADWNQLFNGQMQKDLERALRPFLKRQRWFAGKARTVQSLEIVDSFVLPSTEQRPEMFDGKTLAQAAQRPCCLIIVQATYAEGESESYLLSLAIAKDEAAEDMLIESPQSALLKVQARDGSSVGLIYEATWDSPIWTQLLQRILSRKGLKSGQGHILPQRSKEFSHLAEIEIPTSSPKVFAGQQSNSSAIFDERLIMKLFRRLPEGVNPDVEVGTHVMRHSANGLVPQIVGTLEYRCPGSAPRTLSVLHEFVPNEGDAWDYSLRELDRYLERVPALGVMYEQASPAPSDYENNRGSAAAIALKSSKSPQKAATGSIRALSDPLSAVACEAMSTYLPAVVLLGKRTAEMHLALSKSTGDATFAPEPFTMLYQRSLFQSMRTRLNQSFDLLQHQLAVLPADARKLGTDILAQRKVLNDFFYQITREPIEAQRIRCHGDYHLGQVLFTGKDFVIIDFEGEPDRPISERRIKRSPLSDVAGMLRSFHYVAHTAAQSSAAACIQSSDTDTTVSEWLDLWSQWASAAFLQSYSQEMAGSTLLPQSPPQYEQMLEVFILEKALYELSYELNNRPDWVTIPLAGIASILHNSFS